MSWHDKMGGVARNSFIAPRALVELKKVHFCKKKKKKKKQNEEWREGEKRWDAKEERVKPSG